MKRKIYILNKKEEIQSIPLALGDVVDIVISAGVLDESDSRYTVNTLSEPDSEGRRTISLIKARNTAIISTDGKTAEAVLMCDNKVKKFKLLSMSVRRMTGGDRGLRTVSIDTLTYKAMVMNPVREEIVPGTKLTSSNYTLVVEYVTQDGMYVMQSTKYPKGENTYTPKTIMISGGDREFWKNVSDIEMVTE